MANRELQTVFLKCKFDKVYIVQNLDNITSVTNNIFDVK